MVHDGSCTMNCAQGGDVRSYEHVWAAEPHASVRCAKARATDQLPTTEELIAPTLELLAQQVASVQQDDFRNISVKDLRAQSSSSV
jgi:hypothetical protein